MITSELSELIEDRDVLTANPLLTVLEATRIMADKHVGAVVIVDDGKVVGIFTERDLVVRVIGAGLSPAETSLSDVMTPSPQTVGLTQSVEEVMAWMLSGRFRHLPVVENDTLIGLVSQGDVMAYLHERLYGAQDSTPA
ncbi:MAG: CBS domain-containing protein [Geminicoccaceae bacterium]